MRRRSPYLGHLTAVTLFWACGCGGLQPSTEAPKFPPPRAGVFQDPIPLAEAADDEFLADVAARGGRVVYAATQGDNLDIFIRNLADQGSTRLTEHTTDDSDPVFSPDGTRIAWISQADDVKGDVWVMDVDGSDKQRLTDRRTADQAPSFSADGRVIFFTSRPRRARHSRIERLDLESGERQTVVKRGWDPSPSPDGSALFFVAPDDRSWPRIFAHRLADGVTVPLTDGDFFEGLPRAVTQDNKTVIYFTAFVDDVTGDGVADARDPSSLWAVDYSDEVYQDVRTRPRPLTGGKNREIFASPLEGWFAFTTWTGSDLDIQALPLGGMISPAATSGMILEAARSESDPILRRLALRFVVATSSEREADARYDLAAGLTRQNRFADAIAELERASRVARNKELEALIALEILRVEMLAELEGQLFARTDGQQIAAKTAITKAAEVLATIPQAAAIEARQQTVTAEAEYALGERLKSVNRLEDVVDKKASSEDVARAHWRLNEFYGSLGDLDAMEREVGALIVGHANERGLLDDAVNTWLINVVTATDTPPESRLGAIRGRHQSQAPIAAAVLLRHASLLRADQKHPAANEVLWDVVNDYPSEVNTGRIALKRLSAWLEGNGDSQQALDAYETILKIFSSDPEMRTLAREGIARIAVNEARDLEFKIAAADEATKSKALNRARKIYLRLLRSNPELMVAHRRYIALSARTNNLHEALSLYSGLLLKNPRDKIALYGYAHALSFKTKPDLGALQDRFEEITDIDPRMAAAHLSLGWVYEQLERSSPDSGWLERAADSYDLALRLVAPTGQITENDLNLELFAAAQLNKGNALFGLGVNDAAFASYLAREMSGAPFAVPLTESLFRENFARAALSMGALDVAIDQALLSHKQTKRRKAATAALVAALMLQVKNYEDAESWYDKAATTYRKRSDWIRVIPMLRGKGIALQGQQRTDKALAAFSELLAVITRAGRPGAPQPPGATGLVVTEVPSDPTNVTRAKYGFGGLQEEEIARTQAARILSAWGDLESAYRFFTERLKLLRSEVSGEGGERLRHELIKGLHETALVSARLQKSAEAFGLWTEALTIARPWALDAGSPENEIVRWRSIHMILRAMGQLRLNNNLAWPDEAAVVSRTAANIAVERLLALQAYAQASDYANWLANSFALVGAETDAVAQLPDEAETDDANGRPSQDLKGRVESHLASIDHLAQRAAIADDYRHLSKATQGASKRASPWASLLVEFLETPERRVELLGPALKAYLVDDVNPTATDTLLFVDGALRLLTDNQVEGISAWMVLERLRLLLWRPSIAQLPRHPLAARWRQLEKLGPTDERAQSLAELPAIFNILFAQPVSVARVRQHLGDDVLVQRFAVGDTSWWTLIHKDAVIVVQKNDAAAMPAELSEALAKMPPLTRVFVDLGEDEPLPTFERPAQAPRTIEVLSATHLVSTHEQLALASGPVAIASLTRGGPTIAANDIPESQQTAPSPIADIFERLGGDRRGVLIRGHLVSSGQTRRPGRRDVLFAPPMSLVPARRISLNDYASSQLNAGLLIVESSTDDHFLRRALAHASVLAGVATTAIGNQANAELLESLCADEDSAAADRKSGSGLDFLGHQGPTFSQKIEMASRQYNTSKKDAIGTFAAARRLQVRDKGAARHKWIAAKHAFLELLDLIARVSTEPQLAAFAELQPKVAKVLPRLEIAFVGLLAETYEVLGELDEAAALRRKILAAHEKGGSPKSLASALSELGQTALLAKALADATQYFERCVEVAIDAGLKKIAGLCLNRLASTKRQAYDYPGAEKAYRQAISYFSDDASTEQLDAYRFLGFLYESSMNDYDQALAAFAAAIELATKQNNLAMLPSLRIPRARVLRIKGDYGAALAEIEVATEIAQAQLEEAQSALLKLRSETPEAEQTKNEFKKKLREREDNERDKQRVRAETSLEAARVYWYRGNYRRANLKNEESLALALASGNDYLEIQARSLAGLIALNQGRLDSAERSIRDALLLSRRTGRLSEEAIQLNNLGTVRLSQGNATEAATLFSSALEIDETLGTKEGIAYDLRWLGISKHQLKASDEALPLLDRALQISREIGSRYNEIRVLYAMGEAQEALGSPEAKTSYRAALSAATALNVPEVSWRSSYALGQIALAENNQEEARRLFDEALAIAEGLGRGRSESTELRTRTELYGDAMRLAAKRDLPASVFAYAERYRGRQLLDVLATAPLVTPGSRAKEFLDRELESREAVSKAERSNETSSQPALEEAHDEALAALRRAFPRLARALTIAPVALGEFQNLLGDDTAVLTYSVTRDEVLAALITHDSTAFHSIALKQESLRLRVSELRKKLEAFVPVGQNLKSLSEDLFAEVLPSDAAKKYRRLIIVPDDALHEIPWSALPFDGKAAIDSFVVSLAPSASILSDLISVPRADVQNTKLEAFVPASDLPFARLEARSLDGAQIHFGAEATESRMREAKSDVWVFAGHTRLDANDPMATSLELAQGSNDDGRLELREIFGLERAPSLVTLSACNTNGSGQNGLAWMSLAGAFVTAGSNSVVATQHRVSDLAASVLVKRFVRRLKTSGRAEALRQASLKVREYFSHPAHWAGFTLIGDFR